MSRNVSIRLYLRGAASHHSDIYFCREPVGMNMSPYITSIDVSFSFPLDESPDPI